jgi:thiol-disulfide isomerase/thioredoxin
MGFSRTVGMWVSAGLAGILTVAGCSPGAGTGSLAAQQAGDVRAGTVETFLAADRKPAPAVTGELLDGSRFDLSGWRGRVVVVNFWGSWCAPCRAEAPELEATFQATKGLGVEFLGVDVRDEHDAATSFQGGFGISYPSLFDPPGKVVLGFRDVSPNVVPSTVLIDRELRIAAVFRKRVTQRELEAAVRAVAGEGS